MLQEILTVFAIIFVAELGDKSQILAMSFATRYKVKTVLIGVFVGILLNHSLAVILGMLIGSVIMGNPITYIVGFIFVLFAFLSLI